MTVLAILVGCENDINTPTPTPDNNPENGYIVFDAGVQKSRGVTINNADHDDFNMFSVYAYVYMKGTDWDAYQVLAKPGVFDAIPETVNKDSGFFSYVQDGGELKTWSGNRYSFFAVYPEKSVGLATGAITYPVTGATEGVPYVTYTVPNDPANMVDIMTAAYFDATYAENGSYVIFNMAHRLSAVNVTALNHYEYDHDENSATEEELVEIRIKSLNVKFENLLYNSANIYLDKFGHLGTPTERSPEYKPENAKVASKTYTIIADGDAPFAVKNNKDDNTQREISADRGKTMFFIPQELDMTSEETINKTNIKVTVTGTYEKWYDSDGNGELDAKIDWAYVKDAEGNKIKEDVADGVFTLSNEIFLDRNLDETYKYNVRLNFTSAAVSITILTAEQWGTTPPIYNDFQ